MLNFTTETQPLSIILLIFYCFSILIIFHFLKNSLLNSENNSLKPINIKEDKQQILSELHKICKLWNNWNRFLEILVNNIMFEEYFKDYFDNNIHMNILKEYFEKNRSKMKIKILLFVVAYFDIRREYCSAQDLLKQLKIPKQTISNNINVLEKEGLIERKRIEKQKIKTLMPCY